MKKKINTSVNKGMSMDLQFGLAHEARCFEILFSTEDQKEGMKAFVEKREPNFKGTNSQGSPLPWVSGGLK